MIIEFVGVMGAGKTSLHRRATERLAALGHPVWTHRMVADLAAARCAAALPTAPFHARAIARFRRLLFKTSVAWRSRGAVALAVGHLLRSKRPAGDVLKSLRRFLTCLANYWTARLSIPAEEIVLTDEGVVQKLCAVFIHGSGRVDLAAVRRYARTLPLPDVLVYVVVDAEIARARARVRSRRLAGRFAALQDAELRTVFADTASAFDALVNEIQTATPRAVRIIVVRTDDFERAKATLDAQIASLGVRIYDAA
jgi:thymidylate kinase